MTELSKALILEVKDAGKCRREFNVTAPEEVVKDEAKRALREIAKVASLPGFRAGKVPPEMIKNRYEKELKEEVERKIVSAAFELINGDQDIEVVSAGFAEEPKLELDKAFSFVLNVDVAPDFALPDYKALKVDVPELKIEPKEVAERVELYRNMYAAYNDVEGKAEAGDMLKVDYTSDFAIPEDASPALKRQLEAKDSYLWLNEPEMLPGSIKALTGAEKEHEYELKSTYAKDFREETLAGKTVNYKIKVLAIQRRAPLSDEDLCQKLHVATIKDLEKSLEEAMRMEGENKRRAEVNEKVYEALDKQVAAMDFPPSLLQNETARELRKMANDLVKTAEDADKFKEAMKENTATAEKAAEKALRRSFILRKIAKQQDIRITADEMDAQIYGMSQYYGYKPKEFKEMLRKNDAMDELALDILNAKTLDYLAGIATGDKKD